MSLWDRSFFSPVRVKCRRRPGRAGPAALARLAPERGLVGEYESSQRTWHRAHTGCSEPSMRRAPMPHLGLWASPNRVGLGRVSVLFFIFATSRAGG